MKNFIFTPILILISVLTLAQNWSPIRVNQKMNYQHSDSAYISHTIWVDSAIVEGADSVFFTNRIVKDVPGNPEIVLRNQPQFFGKFMVKQQFGFYLIGEPYNYTIYANADLGDNWSYTGTSGISAEVTSLLTENIFGVTDSVKVISLSDGNEIRLSKNFGILQFPDFENGGYFELVGIQDTDYGEPVPGFWEIYNYEVGDVFQYARYYYDVFYTIYETTKYEITEKEITETGYNYQYEGVYSAFGYDNKGWIAYPISGEWNFVNTMNDPTNLYPFQSYMISDGSSGYGTQRTFTFSKLLKDPETDLIYKQYGVKEEILNFLFYQDDLFYELNVESDTLYRYEQVTMIGLPGGLKGLGFGDGIGFLFSREGVFEYEDHKDLVGYVKDGDTVGIITPDSVLLMVSIDEIRLQKDKVEIYPNPADDFISIKIKNPTRGIFHFELRNSLGQLVKQIEIKKPESTIPADDMESGVYFYSVRHNSEIVSQGKVVIR